MRRFLLILLLTAGLLAARVSDGAPIGSPARVMVIGDSIAGALESEASARSVLAKGVEFDLQLAVCRRLVGESCPYHGSRPPTLVSLLPMLRLAPTVVVAMGYNDSEETFADSVDTALVALRQAGAQRVLWLTLRAERQSYARMNETIRAAATRHPELAIVDWNLYARSHPNWFQPDGLHLTTLGAVSMATLVRARLTDLGIITPPAQRLSIATKRLPTARAGSRYSIRLATRGGVRPVRWSLSSGVLPAGLVLRPSGLLQGISPAARRREVTFRATDVGGASVSRRFLLVVTSA